MSVNKVTAFGENLIDLTEDTVTKDNLIKGVTAHDASGNSVTGNFDTDKYLEKTGDASNTTAVFSGSKERENISTGEKLSVIFGKIAKFFSDLKTVAFTGNYRDLSGTPSVVSKTADGLCPKNGGTTTKFLRDDGTYAVPTSSVIGLSTLEQVTAAATAGNVTAPVGAGALAEVNSSLVDVIQEVELWSQNSSSFEAQTITINNLSTYKRIGIYWAVYSTNFATMYTEIPIYSFNSVGSVLSFYGENHHWRHLRINENDIVFSDGKINTSTETRSAVPMKIIGIK